MAYSQASSRKRQQVGHPVTPGGLSEQDHDRIHALADRGWSCSRIACAITKHPGTVYWFMCREGLIAPKQTDTPKVYSRGGRVVRRFGREEDAFIVALRVQGYGPTAITDLAAKRFGFARPLHSVVCRLVMLAGLESREEAA